MLTALFIRPESTRRVVPVHSNCTRSGDYLIGRSAALWHLGGKGYALGIITDANQQMKTLTGYSWEELIGRDLLTQVRLYGD